MKNSGICFVSLLGGMLVGAAVSMLLTPQSGPELRKAIKNFVDKEVDKARTKYNEVINED
ncbi:YtxH domain-containing protein [uncultured Alistipes sp.]|jgi:gas vesicle protein|uniref:YtxH domain-containing protein n=1 Tax=uncultured Alistipes sp. TaxID=538949 RepID=UPI0025CDD9CD|nr:YtxH domain-containing protein [uncultured Alistipes sp.]